MTNMKLSEKHSRRNPGRSGWSALALSAAIVISAAQSPAQAAGANFKTIYSFPSTFGDVYEVGGLLMGSGGVMYGSAGLGGSFQAGGVYSLTPVAGGTWTENVIYSSPGGNNGQSTGEGLIGIGAGGVLYGTSFLGGSLLHGFVFTLTPPVSPGGTWVFKDIYDFPGGSDGAGPYVVKLTARGVIYGTTIEGGSGSNGVVFALHPPASPSGVWTENVLYDFPVNTINQPLPSGLVIGTGGEIYVCTQTGGTLALGSVFELTPPSSSGNPWTYTGIYDFGAPGDAKIPIGMTLGQGGVLYGASTTGGTGSCSFGCGTVFSLTPPASPGGVWTEAVLYNFTGAGDGLYPSAGPTIGSGGVLYGTTGGQNSKSGQVYSLTPPSFPGGAWTKAVLHHFTGSGTGYYPTGGLIINSAGAIFGTTEGGGVHAGGIVYRVIP
jgi:hypothetical protein